MVISIRDLDTESKYLPEIVNKVPPLKMSTQRTVSLTYVLNTYISDPWINENASVLVSEVQQIDSTIAFSGVGNHNLVCH